MLDADRERAADQYEQIRRKLVKIFAWRGSDSPEDHADETIDRVARKIDEGEEIRNLHGYIGGVARLVWLEWLKKRERQQRAIDGLTITSERLDEDEVERLDCFEACLEKLSPESRQLILNYYREVKIAKIALRKELAEGLGIPPNALRNRAHRIRAKLEACVATCVDGGSTE